jgi:hypothetical protein
MRQVVVTEDRGAGQGKGNLVQFPKMEYRIQANATFQNRSGPVLAKTSGRFRSQQLCGYRTCPGEGGIEVAATFTR